MKTNNFRVKEKKEKKIVIEEERTKNPLLLFFKRYKNFFMLFLISFLVCMLLASIGIAFSLFRGSNDYDITYINGGELINSNNDPEIDDEDVKESLLGEVARAEGVVVLVESFMSGQGDVVSYFTDGTTVIVQSNGNIYRVSPLSDGNYGVDRNGKISDSAKRIAVRAQTNTLSDGTIITYYSDGSAKVELKDEIIFVRDSNNIKLDNGVSFAYTKPSGVALTKSIYKVSNNHFVTTFTDGTSLITLNNQKVIVNKNIKVNVDGDTISYDKHNTYSVISEQTLDDGNVVTHFSNGSAIITNSSGDVIYVKKSGDILLKNRKLYEIISNDYVFSRSVVNSPDGRKVIYFDNGSAIIVFPDGTRQYVEDSDDIIFDENKNISNSPSFSQQISERVTSDGDTVYNFENGKSQVIKSDGSSYIVDTDTLKFLPNGNIADEPSDVDNNKTDNDNNNDSGEKEPFDPAAGIYISEAENKYSNSTKNIEDTTFIIRNDNNKPRYLKITIVEVSNYAKFDTARLDPRYVKFQATVGDEYVPAQTLNYNTWRSIDGVTNYVIYDGKIGARTTMDVALSMYVDYTDITDEYQNTGFLGTINVYVNG